MNIKTTVEEDHFIAATQEACDILFDPAMPAISCMLDDVAIELHRREPDLVEACALVNKAQERADALDKADLGYAIAKLIKIIERLDGLLVAAKK